MYVHVPDFKSSISSIRSITQILIKEASTLTKNFSFVELLITRKRRETWWSIGSQPAKAAGFLELSSQWKHVDPLKIHFESVGGDETTHLLYGEIQEIFLQVYISSRVRRRGNSVDSPEKS